MRFVRSLSVVGFLTAATSFFGSTACTECLAIGCDYQLQATLKNGLSVFTATPTPTVILCASSVCTTYSLDGTDAANVKCKAAPESPDPFSECSFDANGEGHFFGAGPTDDSDIKVSLEVRSPAGDVLISQEQTVISEDKSYCDSPCYEAHPTFTLP